MGMATIEEIVSRIASLDEGAMMAAQERQASLTKPAGSLGRLEELGVWMAGVTGQAMPMLRHKLIITGAADHGVAVQGVSAYPREVTAQMVGNFLRGGAAVNVLARHAGARVVVVDAGVAAALPPNDGLVTRKMAFGTQDLSRGPAMTRLQAEACLHAGTEVLESEVERGADVVGIGDMGIGNTTAASAIVAVITGQSPTAVTGYGTGIDEEGRRRKIACIERALATNQPDPKDPVDVLAKVGGFEIGLLAGVILGAAAARRPVVLDGFITAAAALIACGCAPNARRYLLASHRSQEPGHQAALDHLELAPLLDLGMRLGEGTGAALGIFILEAAVRCMTEMATFAEAGVSQKARR